MNKSALLIGATVLAVAAFSMSRGSKKSNLPDQIEATFSDGGLVATWIEGDQPRRVIWVLDSYPGVEDWAEAVISDITKILAPNGKLVVYRPSDAFVPATDALKAARNKLDPSILWFLSLRDV